MCARFVCDLPSSAVSTAPSCVALHQLQRLAHYTPHMETCFALVALATCILVLFIVLFLALFLALALSALSRLLGDNGGRLRSAGDDDTPANLACVVIGACDNAARHATGAAPVSRGFFLKNQRKAVHVKCNGTLDTLQ